MKKKIIFAFLNDNFRIFFLTFQIFFKKIDIREKTLKKNYDL